MIQREPIYEALFARLQSIPGLVTVSRVLKHWDDVPKSQQPAVFMTTGRQIANTQRGQPTIWKLESKVYIYASTSGGLVPGTVLNNLLDAVEAVLQGNPVENVQTLGGLVDYCRIDGEIETDEGTLGDQAVAIVPIEILAS